jgi:hypothetical protein
MELTAMFSATSFAPGLFSEIVRTATKAGYAFARFDRLPEAGKRFFLRHDVDISPRAALLLGRLAQEHGAASNFFFQLNAETYNIFSDDVLDIMRDLRARGHCVGLHIDQARFGDDEAAIRRTVDWFSSCVIEIDEAVSFHRPSESVLGKSYAAFLNAYDPRFFSPDSYLSDSRRSLAFLPTLAEWLAGGKPSIQLLLHPEWWSGVEDETAAWAELKARREQELAQYVTTNFAKVFHHVITAERRNFRI